MNDTKYDDNTCDYSHEWQPYIGDYDKYEYDIKLHNGAIITNCYPNAGKFISFVEGIDKDLYEEVEVSEIRFAENPVLCINPDSHDTHDVNASAKPPLFNSLIDYDRPEVYQLTDTIKMYDETCYWGQTKAQRQAVIVSARNSNVDPKIQRNSLCSCGSGKKYKNCCG